MKTIGYPQFGWRIPASLMAALAVTASEIATRNSHRLAHAGWPSRASNRARAHPILKGEIE